MMSLRYVLEATKRSAQDPRAQTNDGLQSAIEVRPLPGSTLRFSSNEGGTTRAMETNEQRLTDAEMHNLPALAGVVRFIEADPAIERILISGPPGFRFRQSVGVAVKLKMAKLGWRSTGRKGAVKGASHFTKAERFAPGPAAGDDYAAGALAAIDAVGQIGEDSERQSTGRALMDALAATRRSEGRPF